MTTFQVYTTVHDGLTSHNFAPGDELPEWAEDLVGAHCLEPEAEIAAEPHDDSTDAGGDSDPEPDADEEEAGGEEPVPAPADAPDFTAPAPARRNSRSRR